MKKLSLLGFLCLFPLLLPGGDSLAIWPTAPGQSAGWKLPGGAGWSRDEQGSMVLHIVNGDPHGAAFASHALNLRSYAGQRILVTAEVKAVNVSKPPAPYLGIKFMLPYDENGTRKNSAAMDGTCGDFDYRKFSLTITVPQEVKPTELILGLQNSTGNVWFRNLNIQVLNSESFVWPQKQSDLEKWNLPGQFDWSFDPQGRCVLHVGNRTQGQGGVAALPLDLKTYAGKIVEISAEIKAVDVSAPKIGYLGVKFMLPYEANGGTNWPSATDGLHGNFDFKPFRLIVALPAATRNANVNFGLQDSTGDAYFRNFKIRIVPSSEVCPAPFKLPENFQCEYSDAVREAPVLRGVMTPDPRFITQKDVADLGKWGANLVRWQFNSFSAGSPQEYRKNLDDSIDKLISFAPDFRKAGIKVVFDMHTAPGGGLAELNGSSCLRIYMEDDYLKLYVETWRHIAERLNGLDIIWGYDLINEPTYGGQNVKYNYLKVQYEAAKAIREVDPETPIFVESDQMARVDAFPYLEPLPLKNIFYEFHFYIPEIYTHQGVSEISRKNFKAGQVLSYPSQMGGDVMVDRAALSKMLEPVRDFQRKYGAKLYCGEFSAIRWAPGAAQYIDDIASLLEELGCSWTYHAYREWQGWSVEHDENIDHENPVSYDTDRKKVLLKYFAKNRK